jgi:ABC-type Fe3+ transport system permease subunit
VILAGILVVATVIGMVQARAMTGLRRKVIANPKDNSASDALRRGRLLANGIRGLMALLTLAIVLLAAIALAQ